MAIVRIVMNCTATSSLPRKVLYYLSHHLLSLSGKVHTALHEYCASTLRSFVTILYSHHITARYSTVYCNDGVHCAIVLQCFTLCQFLGFTNSKSHAPLEKMTLRARKLTPKSVKAFAPKNHNGVLLGKSQEQSRRRKAEHVDWSSRHMMMPLFLGACSSCRCFVVAERHDEMGPLQI